MNAARSSTVPEAGRVATLNPSSSSDAAMDSSTSASWFITTTSTMRRVPASFVASREVASRELS
jgi:hypothetical protein